MMTVIEIGQAMFDAKHEPMDQRTAEAFVILTMSEMRGIDLGDDVRNSFNFQVIAKRLDYHFKERIATDAIIAVCALVSGNVGSAVMYAAAIAAMHVKLRKKIDITDMVADFFSDGFPPDSELERIWRMQKVGGANSLDMTEAWPTEEKIDG
jgi:hypothetical protein